MRRRRISKFDRMSERGRSLVIGMLEAKGDNGTPLYTYLQITDELKATTGEGFNHSDLHRLKTRLGAEARELEEKAIRRQEFASQVSRALDLGEDKERALEEALDYALYSNETDLTEVPPEQVLRARLAFKRIQLQERKVQNQEERLKLENRKLQMEIAKLEREKERREKEEREKRAAAEKAIEKAKGKTVDERVAAAMPKIRQIYGWNPKVAEATSQ